MKILQKPLTDDLKKKIYAGFKEHASEKTGQDGISKPIAFISTENNEPIGAVVIVSFWGALHVKYTWVDKKYRNQGIGKQLLNRALDYGRSLNSSFAFVETMSFQALDFYQKLGFKLEYTRYGYTDGISFHYLRKDFAPSLKFKKLTEIDKDDILELMNNQKVRKHLPLLKGNFDIAQYNSFIAAKEKMWKEVGYGPWTFTLNDIFIGWGGLQPVDDDVEIALVLHPNYWGQGKLIYKKIIKDAFESNKINSIIILLPPSRTKVKGIYKLGFKEAGICEFSGKQYVRYRLYRDQYND
jgi:[ribosomal protein S5]-alanine N-acetyltransferase